jgi:hypothetical protein
MPIEKDVETIQREMIQVKKDVAGKADTQLLERMANFYNIKINELNKKIEALQVKIELLER